MMKEDFSTIDGIILEFLQGKITQEEKSLLVNWINETPANKDYFKQIYRIWKISETNSFEEDEIDKAYQVTQLKINNQSDAYELSKRSRASRFIVNYGKWAAAIIISLFIGAYMYSLVADSSLSFAQMNAYQEINVPLGSKSNIYLPDGTLVYLNAGSSLTYKTSFGKKKHGM